MRNILIIKCGETYPDLQDQHGDFEQWIISQSNLPENVFRVVNVATGEIPRHPSEYIAAIISGSHANVNQRMEWIKQLKDWIITARYSNIPVLGICFGHQIIATALGGIVKPNPAGIDIGIENILLTAEGKKDELFKHTGNSFESYKFHSFSVKELPSGAVLLATSENSKVEAFRIDKIYGIQFHADFSAAVMRNYLENSKVKGTNKIRVRLKSSFKNQSIISNFLDEVLKF